MDSIDAEDPTWPAGVRRAHEDDSRVRTYVQRIGRLDGDIAVMRMLGATKRQRRKTEQTRAEVADELQSLLAELDNPTGVTMSSGRRRYD